MSRFAQAIALLTATKVSVAEMLNATEDEAFRIKITTDIQRNIDYLNLLTGTGDLTPVNKVALPPATTIGGQPINKPRKVHRDDLEPEARKVETLQEKVEALYSVFLTIETKDLLNNYDHLVIRGVARKAKMKVTRDEPAELTLEFIEHVKREISHLNQVALSKQINSEIENAFQEAEKGRINLQGDDNAGEKETVSQEIKLPETENSAPVLENKEVKVENPAKPAKKTEPKKGK